MGLHFHIAAICKTGGIDLQWCMTTLLTDRQDQFLGFIPFKKKPAVSFKSLKLPPSKEHRKKTLHSFNTHLLYAYYMLDTGKTAE